MGGSWGSTLLGHILACKRYELITIVKNIIVQAPRESKTNKSIFNDPDFRRTSLRETPNTWKHKMVSWLDKLMCAVKRIGFVITFKIECSFE